jgi:hypothetical protein
LLKITIADAMLEELMGDFDAAWNLYNEGLSNEGTEISAVEVRPLKKYYVLF